MRLVFAIAITAAAAIFPLFAGEFWVTLMTQIMIFGLLALSTDLLLGNAGLFSLGHASFFAVAAYTTAILQVRHGMPTIVAAPAGILAGTLLAMLFAFSVRTRGVYFILITLAFGYIVWGVAYRWASFTGGDNGVTNVPYPAIGSWAITNSVQYF
jgi:branched-chain amino acid transport system permease protein